MSHHGPLVRQSNLPFPDHNALLAQRIQVVQTSKQSSKVAQQRFIRRQWLRAFQAYVDARSNLAWRLDGRRRFTLEKLAEQATQQRWCFIVGCNNSGTTLVSQLLENIEGVSGFAYEGQRYTKALVRAARKGHERVWSEFLDELRLTEKDEIDIAPRLLHDWLLALEKPPQPLIVEKTTCNAVRMRWLQKVFPNSVFVAMIRDGYAVVEGSYRKGEQDISRAAKHWNLVNKLIVEDSAHVKNVYLLRYEELISDQNHVVSKLAELLKLPETSLALGLQAEYGFNTLESMAPQTIRDYNEASKARLDAKDIRLIEAEAKEMLNHFGYKA